MRDNELEMKARGEEKVFKDILTAGGNAKNISSTQTGQQILFDEALRILPQVWDWINNTSARVYRGELKAYFIDEQFLTEKITETLLFLSGAIYYGETFNEGAAHKSRHKNVNSLEKKLMSGLGFNNTFRFLEVVVDHSQYFFKDHKVDTNGTSFKTRVFFTCNLSEIIVEKLAQKASSSFYPMPMTEEPVSWYINEEGKAIGGYKTYQYQLVRADQRHIDYNKFSHKILDSINYIQSTAWIVNKKLLEVVKRDLKTPLREDYVKMAYPQSDECRWELKTPEQLAELGEEEREELRLIRSQNSDQVALYKAEQSDFESALGKYRAIKLAVSICEKYKDEEALYFPHSYDFRGRVYPLPIGLSPQGSDTIKSLLLYKNVKVATKSGQLWNWAYLASLYGEDKLDFLDRVQKGKDLLFADYKDADEPYQFLSHQLELQKWMNDLDYIPNTRIHLDACNSGSQFTSAITGDRAGCEATNVIPSYEDGKLVRRDAYLLVAERALELTGELVRGAKDKKTKQMYQFFYNLLKEKGRKICKVPVMVSNYGGTEGGRTEILWNMFRELKVDRKWITRKVASAFGKIIGQSITGTLSGGKAFEGYIQKMNGLIAKQNRPVEWKTSDGFHVVHIKNKELAPKQVVCILPSSRKATKIMKKVYSDNVSVTKMKSAISPNYIHSLDAELLRRVALRMEAKGIRDSDWIHDSFGCHPNEVELMLDLTKQEFADLVKADPLKVLDRQLRFQMDDTRKTFRVLGETEIPFLDGFKISDGVEVVKDSDWFFS